MSPAWVYLGSRAQRSRLEMTVAAEPTTGYAPVNGTNVYWESRGAEGTPLIVVHGGYGLTTMFGDVLDLLARQRQVVAIELRGHGHTRDIPGPFTWEGLGDDIAGVAAHLGFGQADLLGWSLGGSAALRCAIQHPALVRKLVVVSAPCRRDAWFPEILAAFDQMSSATLFDQLRQSPMYAEWVKVAPDSTPPAPASAFFALLGGGQRDGGWDGSLAPAARLAILPGMTHYDIGASPRLAAAVGDFL